MRHLPQHAGKGSHAAPSLILAIIFAVLMAAVGAGIALLVPLKSGGTWKDTDLALQSGNDTVAAEAQSSDDATADVAGDPSGCIASFALADADLNPVMQKTGQLYSDLPLPIKDGQVFGGWYTSAEAAQALDYRHRVGPSTTVQCSNEDQVLYGAWVTPERNAEAATALPILMYHQFTTNPEGEDNWLRDNYTYIGDFESHLQYIKDNNFYIPDWHEVSAFIDGKLYLPDQSVVITDDDADPSWNELAAPLAEKYQLPITSFVIGVDGPGPELSQYVRKRSHTYDMHSAGENGKGRMVNWPVSDVVNDLNKSAEILGGVKEIVAYPYGHYNDDAKEAMREAGYELGRTVEQGYVTIGTDKLALPCVRMNYGAKTPQLAAAIG